VHSLFSNLLQAKEARKKAIDDMDPKIKEAFENIQFYKFYPVKTLDTPDVSNVKVCDIAPRILLGTYYHSTRYILSWI
jgi:hypothetical protein